MRLSHEYKFIFFANPKTGSESVRKILDPYSNVCATTFRNRSQENPFYSHITPVETRDIFFRLGWDFDSYHKFCFVRNPWAKIVSLYKMIFAKSIIKPRFNRWIYEIEPNGIGGGGDDADRWRKYGAYSIENYVSDESGSFLVDKIIKLEDIHTQLIPLLEKIGIPKASSLSIPNLNSSSVHKKYSTYYNKKSMLHVKRLYKYEIEKFDYYFEN